MRTLRVKRKIHYPNGTEADVKLYIWECNKKKDDVEIKKDQEAWEAKL